MFALEETVSMWVLGTLCLLLGIVIGCIATYLLTSRNNRTGQLQFELDELKSQFGEYRDQVSRHFMRTSELVQEMTESYRSVYEHLAHGAQRLCGDPALSAIAAAPASASLADDSLSANDDREQDLRDFDELEELSRLRQDIDQLMSEAPQISDQPVASNDESTRQH